MNIHLIEKTETGLITVFSGIWHHLKSDTFSKFSVSALLKTLVREDHTVEISLGSEFSYFSALCVVR